MSQGIALIDAGKWKQRDTWVHLPPSWIRQILEMLKCSYAASYLCSVRLRRGNDTSRCGRKHEPRGQLRQNSSCKRLASPQNACHADPRYRNNSRPQASTPSSYSRARRKMARRRCRRLAAFSPTEVSAQHWCTRRRRKIPARLSISPKIYIVEAAASIPLSSKLRRTNLDQTGKLRLPPLSEQ